MELMLFTDRRDLQELYYLWARDRSTSLGRIVSDSPINVIGFLQANCLLNEDACKEFLKDKQDD